HESKRKRINSLVYTDEKIEELIKVDFSYHEKLMSRLREISKLSGRMKFSDEGGAYYDEWYNDLRSQSIDDKTGSINRLGDQVLKVAMLISISNRDDLTLTKSDLTIAIDESEKCLLGVRIISMEKEKGDINPIIEKVLKELIKSPEQMITRRRLLVVTHIESILLDRALDTLIQRGAIDEPKRNSKKEIFYKMKKEVYETYVKFKSSERKVN